MARPAAATIAWVFLFLSLLAITLAIVLSCSGSCRAAPVGTDAGTAPSGYGNVPTSEPEQPPGPTKDMGSVPGPSTWGQAAVGILLPGLIGLGIALILNQSGARGNAIPTSPAAPTAPPQASSPGQVGAAPPGLPLPASSSPPQTDMPSGPGQDSQGTMIGWDRAKAGKAAESMEKAVRTLTGSAEAAEQGGTEAAGGSQAGLVKKGSVEAVAIGSGLRTLLDRIASRISEDEELRQRGRKETPAYAENLEMLEVPEGNIDRELSETRQALSQTERSMAKLDASAARVDTREALQSRLEGNLQGREAAGIGGEIVGQADEAAKEYLEYLALRRDLRLKEAVFEYRRKRDEPAAKEDESA
jgi:hypothetical protein